MTTINDDKLDGIIRRIKGLLAMAEDNSNEEEAQSAFTMAQKLMIKYNVEQSEIEDGDNTSSITTGQATAYKTLFWYERVLGGIIANNFRVKLYYNNKYLKKETKKKRTVMFYGLEHDVKIAKELFILANEAIVHYAKKFIDDFYTANTQYSRGVTLTTDLKNSYMRGFTDGLRLKLTEQRDTLQQEFGLVVLMPQVVVDSYDEFSKDFGKGTSLKMPKIEDVVAYEQGKEDGNKIDYTKSTIND